MEPLSLRARSVLEAYKREHAPSPAALQHARAALLARAPLITPSEPHLAIHAPRWTHARLFATATLALVSLGLTVYLGWPRTNEVVVTPPVNVQPTAQLSAAPARQSAVLVAPVERASASLEEVAQVSLQRVPPPRARAHRADRAVPPDVSVARIETRTHMPDPREAEQTLDAIVASHEVRARTPEAVSTSTVRVSKHAVATPDSQVADSSLDAELKSIRKVYRLLDEQEPEQALRALRDHALRFRFPKLQELASVARMLALCEAGKTDEARRLAEGFVARHPESIHAPRVRAICQSH